MGRAKPKTIAEWMKKFWIYDIGTGSGDNCTMGCESCKHTKLREVCTIVKARFAKDHKMLDKAKSTIGHNFKAKIWAPVKRPQKHLRAPGAPVNTGAQNLRAPIWAPVRAPVKTFHVPH